MKRKDTPDASAKASKKDTNVAVLPESLAARIYLVRGAKVMLDADLAEIYGVETKILNQSVGRNIERFPQDFIFQPITQEVANLKSQFVTSSWGGTRKLPYVFTEHGVAMLSSVIRSQRAVQMNIVIIRAFVQLRELLATNKDFAARLEKIERGRRVMAPLSKCWQKSCTPSSNRHHRPANAA